MIKEITIFGVGITIGVASSMKYFEKKYKDISDDEISSIKERTDEKMEALNAKIDEMKKPKQGHDISEEESKPTKKAAKKKTDKKAVETIPVNYNSISSDEKPVEIKKPEPKKEEHTKPYIVSEEEVMYDGQDEIDTVSLEYYMQDETLVEANDIIVDKDAIVGDDNLKILEDGDSDVIYVMNPEYEILYEVYRVADFWN